MPATERCAGYPHLLKRDGYVFIGRAEVQRHGHVTNYAIGVEVEHKQAWLEQQQQRFLGTQICVEELWPDNGTILAWFEGPPRKP